MAYQKPTYKRQVIATLSAIANCNFGQKFAKPTDPDIAAKKAVSDALTKDGAIKSYINKNNSQWELVWGPVTSNSLAQCKWHSDNTMFVAKTDTFPGLDHPLYVVAIAGTNAISMKGWLQEDANVWKQYKWPTKKSRSGKISSGTQLGVSILQDMKHDGQSLLDFFKGLDLTTQGKPYEIATTGHSLGGALSPVLALVIKEWAIAEKHKNIVVSANPSAGATPGNKRFANYYIDTLGAENYHSIINANDMVPHAWEPDMLKMIPDLFDNKKFGFIKINPKLIHLMNDYIHVLSVRHPFQKYTRIAKEQEQLTTFQGRPNPENTKCKDFGVEAIYQHTIAYFLDGFLFPDGVKEQIIAIERQKSPA
ncbi:MAG: lipase [Bacteroidota bacterium]